MTTQTIERTDRRTRAPVLLAAAIVAQPVLLGVNAMFHPDVELSGESILAGAAENPSRWFAVHMVAATGALLGAPAAFALRRVVVRHRALADLAVVAAVIGAAVLSMSFAAEASSLRLVAEADIAHDDAVAIADAYTDTPEFFAVGAGLLATTAAAVLFAIALLRERTLPRWIPVALLLGTAATTVAPPGTPIGPVGFGITAAAGVALVPWVRRSVR